MTIKKLFKERDRALKKLSKEIVKELVHVTQAAEELLADGNEVEWANAELVNRIVIIIGFVKFPIGQQVLLPETGDVIQVTEENQHMLKQVIRVGVPIKLANEKDKEAVKEYLQNANEGEESAEVQTKPAEEDFSTESLTKEQLQQIMWHSENTSKGKVN